MAAYFAVLKPGDRILGMNLAHGGHLTHGSPVNFSGRLYEVHAYGVDRETERIDYDALEAQASGGPPEVARRGRLGVPADLGLRADGGDRPRRRRAAVRGHGPRRGPRGCGAPPEPVPARGHRHDHHAQDAARAARRPRLRRAPTCPTASTARTSRRSARTRWRPAIDKSVFPGVQGGPLMHVIAAKAVALQLATTDELPARPGPHDRERRRPGRDLLAEAGARLISRRHGQPPRARGRDAARRDRSGGRGALDDVGITVNKNAIPFDQNPPNIASGIRIGTPATTTRGLGPEEMRRSAA